MKLTFVTTNKHKVVEAQKVMDKYSVELEQLAVDYEENHDASIEIIARDAAKLLAEKLHKPVIVEDTGIFFEAYSNFPGALPKFVFNSLGYKGIFKLLNGENKNAYFKSVIGYCEPGKDPVIFEGFMHGKIIDKIINKDKDCLPYERIFVPKAYNKTTSEMTTEEKNAISHRGNAFRKLGEFLVRK